MNAREKFQGVLDFNTSIPVPEWEFAYWFDTLQRWYSEGLTSVDPPVQIQGHQWVGAEASGGYTNDVNKYFGFDEGVRITWPLIMFPSFKKEVYSEDEEKIIYRREDGKKVETRKDGTTMPNFLEYPVKDRKDFNEIKRRFNPDSPERFEGSFVYLSKEKASRKYPVQMGGGNFCGFYSVIRELIGAEESLYLFYDDPGFVIEILEFFTDYYISLYSKFLESIEVDYILIWEDMAFKNGPLISPDIFKEFLMPYYKKLTEEMRRRGVKHFIVDTDGNFEALIPLFIESGVTGFYPFEVQAGMDIEKIRKQYPKLVIMGGIDKMALAKTKREIDIELAKVGRMLGKGGYLPYVDHMVPPEVSFENYKYFRYRLKRIIQGG